MPFLPQDPEDLWQPTFCGSPPSLQPEPQPEEGVTPPSICLSEIVLVVRFAISGLDFKSFEEDNQVYFYEF